MSHIVKILSERERKQHVEYSRNFQLIGAEKGSGYWFPCDKDGNIIPDEHYDCWRKNYEYCLSHPEEYIDEGATKHSWWYTENAKALCSCGEEIELYDAYMGACSCPNCGQWYNLFGQSLIDPKYWEDEL